MVKGLVSTIIPVYNRAGMLRESVASVLAQTYRPLEIIIVDDGSTDDTLKTSDEMADKYPDEISVISKTNAGAGLAREAGRQAARGEFIQYLDSDDLLLPRKFELQIAALREHPECGVAYGYSRLINDTGDVLRAPYKWTGRTLLTLFPRLLVERWWNTNSPLYRRTVCDAVGSWTDMRICEDWEYEARVGALGTKLVHCREFLSEYRLHSQDRLTGKPYTPQTMKDTARFLVTLYECARRAGVEHDCIEMQHFSRWAFLIARQAGALGLSDVAEKSLGLARLSAGQDRAKGLDFKIYAAMSFLFGWKFTGNLSCQFDRLLKHKQGGLS